MAVHGVEGGADEEMRAQEELPGAEQGVEGVGHKEGLSGGSGDEGMQEVSPAVAAPVRSRAGCWPPSPHRCRAARRRGYGIFVDLLSVMDSND